MQIYFSFCTNVYVTRIISKISTYSFYSLLLPYTLSGKFVASLQNEGKIKIYGNLCKLYELETIFRYDCYQE